MEPARRAAIALVPEVMATVFRVLPLRYERGILTVAVAVVNEAARDDLKHLLGLERVDTVVWPEDRVRQEIAEQYGCPEVNLDEWLRQLEATGG
jgi:hypothetical protein